MLFECFIRVDVDVVVVVVQLRHIADSAEA